MIRDSILVLTGGTGTFGYAFTKHALDRGAKEIRIYSRDELKQSDMAATIVDKRVRYFCGCVRDLSRLIDVCQGADIMVHAAAMKRLEACEKDPQEAVKTNVMGSINVINACLATGIKNAISLSSDKAVYPVNTYGKTKALMEGVWIQSNGDHRKTKFSVVRYGNVMGSRGSVADLFRKQARTGRILVTNENMTRFFMPVRTAVGLVDYALANQQGGEIYLPFLKATTIGRLAKTIGKGKKIVIIGPRPGEKVHEAMITDKELTRATVPYKAGIVIVNPEYCIWTYDADNRRAPTDFPVSSDTGPQFTDKELNDLLEVSPT